MITHNGSTVTVIGGNFDKGTVEVQHEGGQRESAYIYDLKADGGPGEIVRALIAAHEAQPQADHLLTA